MAIKLLKCGANPNSDVRGSTPLWDAANRGHKKMVTELLEHGANPNIFNSSVGGIIPLLIASSRGDKEVVSELLKYGANPNTVVRRRTPLADAAARGHKEVVTELLKYGADPIIEKHNSNLFSAAVKNGHQEIAAEVLANAVGSLNAEKTQFIPKIHTKPLDVKIFTFVYIDPKNLGHFKAQCVEDLFANKSVLEAIKTIETLNENLKTINEAGINTEWDKAVKSAIEPFLGGKNKILLLEASRAVAGIIPESEIDKLEVPASLKPIVKSYKKPSGPSR